LPAKRINKGNQRCVSVMKVGAATSFADQFVKLRNSRSQDSLHDASTFAFVNCLLDPLTVQGHLNTLEARHFSAVDTQHGNTWTALFWR